jgi:hypothetical protein
MTEKLNASPLDKYKSIYGENLQANYLIDAKGEKNNSEAKDRSNK